MRRIACALVVALVGLGVTEAQAAPPKKVCKTVKVHGKRGKKAKTVRRCRTVHRKPAQPTRPATPAPVTPAAPPASTAPAPDPAPPASAPAPVTPPATPVGPPSLTIGPAGASTTSPLTVTVANLPAAAPGEHYVVRLIGTSATATQCVFGVEIADVTAPVTVTPSGAWCAGPWQGDLLAMDADGDTDAPIASVTFAIS